MHTTAVIPKGGDVKSPLDLNRPRLCSPECWRHHLPCALDRIAELERDLQAARDELAEMDENPRRKTGR